jgi:hypothetical protein
MSDRPPTSEEFFAKIREMRERRLQEMPPPRVSGNLLTLLVGIFIGASGMLFWCLMGHGIASLFR